MEYKIGSAGTFHIGICSENDANNVFPTTDNYMGESSKSVGISDGNGSYYISGSATSYGSSYTSGDIICLLYTSPSPRDGLLSRMPSSA